MTAYDLADELANTGKPGAGVNLRLTGDLISAAVSSL